MIVRPVPPSTPLELHVLHAIAELTAADGLCPSYDEICAELDLSSKSQVVAPVQSLIAKGWLRRRTKPGDMRGFRSLELQFEPPPLPEHAVDISSAGRVYLAGARHG